MKTYHRLVAVGLMLAGFAIVSARGELTVEGRLNGAMLNLRWSGEGNLFLIQHSASLSAPAWRTAGVTVATDVDLDTCGEVGFYRVAAIQAPLEIGRAHV